MTLWFCQHEATAFLRDDTLRKMQPSAFEGAEGARASRLRGDVKAGVCVDATNDHSTYMVETAKRKAEERGLAVEFKNGDAHDLPFDAETFDLVISECTTCALDKQKAIAEMVRVVRCGGYVGISDLYWKEGASERLKSKLVELENERPERLAGWVHLFEGEGLQEVKTKDMSGAIATMTRDMRKQLGVLGQLKIMLRIIRRWGIWPLGRIVSAERIFRSKHLGYAIVVGRKGS